MSPKSEEIISKKIKINFIFPDNLESKFVNNVVIQHQRDYFTLYFFETIPPPILGETKEEKQNYIEKIESVDSKCIARFILTPEKMEVFINAMQENLNSHKKIIEFEEQQKNNSKG